MMFNYERTNAHCPNSDWRNFYGWMRPDLSKICRRCRWWVAMLCEHGLLDVPARRDRQDGRLDDETRYVLNATAACGCINAPKARLRQPF